MRTNVFGFALLLSALGACTSTPETGQVTAPAAESPAAAGRADVAYSPDSLQRLAQRSFELVEYHVRADTLQLVSTSDFLFHPFGRLATIQEFQRQNPAWSFQKVTDPADAAAVLYRCAYNNSWLKLFADGEKKALEIVAGHVTTLEAPLANRVVVGMSKREFFATFLRQPSTLEAGSRVVELESGLDGIRHYYTFQQDKLTSIDFDSDYQFSKR